eukprot:1963529-Prymnesium_polylepis.2
MPSFYLVHHHHLHRHLVRRLVLAGATYLALASIVLTSAGGKRPLDAHAVALGTPVASEKGAPSRGDSRGGDHSSQAGGAVGCGRVGGAPTAAGYSC